MLHFFYSLRISASSIVFCYVSCQGNIINICRSLLADMLQRERLVVKHVDFLIATASFIYLFIVKKKYIMLLDFFSSFKFWL